jgi:uncharacterized protein YgiM (DUF1202 family)
MKTKFNPAYILLMLQEVKQISDNNSFNTLIFSNFLKKYPSFNNFKKILISKGLFESKLGVERWIGVEPNLIMAKEVFRIYLENKKQIAENKKKITENKKMDSISKEEYEIDSHKMPYVEGLEKENSKLNLKLQDLRENISNVIKVSKKETEIKNKKISELEVVIVELKKANGSLINQLGETQNQVFFDRDSLCSSNTYLNHRTNDLTQENVTLKNKLKNAEDLLDGLKKELQIKCDLLEEKEINSVSVEDLSNLNKKIYQQKQKILNLDKTLLEKDLIIENLKSISVAESPSVSKKVKLFGIPIYSSETK